MAKTCDKCDQKVPSVVSVYAYRTTDIGARQKQHFDLCAECHDVLLTALHTKPVWTENPR